MHEQNRNASRIELSRRQVLRTGALASAAASVGVLGGIRPEENECDRGNVDR